MAYRACHLCARRVGPPWYSHSRAPRHAGAALAAAAAACYRPAPAVSARCACART